MTTSSQPWTERWDDQAKNRRYDCAVGFQSQENLLGTSGEPTKNLRRTQVIIVSALRDAGTLGPVPQTTTAHIAEAAGISPKQVRVWGKKELLPVPQILQRGRRGRAALWPDGSIEQALWVRAYLDAGYTVENIRAFLAQGSFNLAAVRALFSQDRSYLDIREILRKEAAAQ